MSNTAHVLISCIPGRDDLVISELKKFDSVKSIEPVCGAYDIVVKIELPSNQNIKQSILLHIRKIHYILTTLTLTHIDKLTSSKQRFKGLTYQLEMVESG